MHVSIAQANLPNMYLEYSPISCWFFFSPIGLCSRSLCTSLCSGRDPASFWCWHQTPCEKQPIYLSGSMKEFIWKKFGKWRTCEEFAWKMWWMFKEKWKTYMGKWCGKNMEKWRICMETWRIYKEKWRISMEKWRIRLEKWKNLYCPTVF